MGRLAAATVPAGSSGRTQGPQSIPKEARMYQESGLSDLSVPTHPRSIFAKVLLPAVRVWNPTKFSSLMIDAA